MHRPLRTAPATAVPAGCRRHTSSRGALLEVAASKAGISSGIGQAPEDKWSIKSQIEAAASIYGIAPSEQAVIKVIGVGGGGSNVVNRMMNDNLQGVESWVLNTDAQALVNSAVPAPNRIQLGIKATRGLGAGGNPDVGSRAAQESRAMIEDAVRGADMVFVTAGLGGGTGSGAAPMVCQIAREMGILTIAFVTMPFSFEGRKRAQQAREAAELVSKATDTMVIVPNDRLLAEDQGGDLPLGEAFKLADSVLVSGVRGICDIILVPGMINVDFADVKAIMHCAGNSLMSHGVGTGKGRAIQAATAAISSPLLETGIHDATGCVWNITGPPDLSLREVNEAADIINEVSDPSADIIFGAVVDDALQNEVHITLIATGFTKAPQQQKPGAGASEMLPIERTGAPQAPGAVKIPAFLQKRRR